MAFLMSVLPTLAKVGREYIRRKTGLGKKHKRKRGRGELTYGPTSDGALYQNTQRLIDSNRVPDTYNPMNQADATGMRHIGSGVVPPNYPSNNDKSTYLSMPPFLHQGAGHRIDQYGLRSGQYYGHPYNFAPKSPETMRLASGIGIGHRGSGNIPNYGGYVPAFQHLRNPFTSPFHPTVGLGRRHRKHGGSAMTDATRNYLVQRGTASVADVIGIPKTLGGRRKKRMKRGPVRRRKAHR